MKNLVAICLTLLMSPVLLVSAEEPAVPPPLAEVLSDDQLSTPVPLAPAQGPAYAFFDEPILFCTWTCFDGTRDGAYVATEGACGRACRLGCGSYCFVL
jgi:hypothetical protein